MKQRGKKLGKNKLIKAWVDAKGSVTKMRFEGYSEDEKFEFKLMMFGLARLEYHLQKPLTLYPLKESAKRSRKLVGRMVAILSEKK